MPDDERGAARTQVYRHAELGRLVDPESVAIIGASPRENSFGDRVRRNLAGFRGRVHLVNARYERIEDTLCHASIAALPESAGLRGHRGRARGGRGGARAIAPRRASATRSSSPPAMRETGKPGRAEQQARLAALARRHGIRLIGPNCIGIANYTSGAAITFSGTPHREAVGPKAVGVVSQSGALGFALAQGIERGVAISHVLTSGNACDVDSADFIAYLAEDPACGAIACLFEGMAAPRRLLEAAGLARAQRASRSSSARSRPARRARAAAMSHTGSLAGSEEAWRAAFDRAGVVQCRRFRPRCSRPRASSPRRRRRRRAASWWSRRQAAPASWRRTRRRSTASRCRSPADETRAVLEARIPEFGSPRNPCDVTAQVITDPESFRACCQAVLDDPAYGALVTPLVYAYAPTLKRLPVMSELAARDGQDRLQCLAQRMGGRAGRAGDGVGPASSPISARWRAASPRSPPGTPAPIAAPCPRARPALIARDRFASPPPRSAPRRTGCSPSARPKPCSPSTASR